MQSAPLQLEEITLCFSGKENNFPLASVWKLEFNKADVSTASPRLSHEGLSLYAALLHVFTHPACFSCQHSLLPCPPPPWHVNYTPTRWHSLACDMLKVRLDAYNSAICLEKYIIHTTAHVPFQFCFWCLGFSYKCVGHFISISISQHVSYICVCMQWKKHTDYLRNHDSLTGLCMAQNRIYLSI